MRIKYNSNNSNGALAEQLEIESADEAVSRGSQFKQRVIESSFGLRLDGGFNDPVIHHDSEPNRSSLATSQYRSSSRGTGCQLHRKRYSQPVSPIACIRSILVAVEVDVLRRRSQIFYGMGNERILIGGVLGGGVIRGFDVAGRDCSAADLSTDVAGTDHAWIVGAASVDEKVSCRRWGERCDTDDL